MFCLATFFCPCVMILNPGFDRWGATCMPGICGAQYSFSDIHIPSGPPTPRCLTLPTPTLDVSGARLAPHLLHPLFSPTYIPPHRNRLSDLATKPSPSDLYHPPTSAPNNEENHANTRRRRRNYFWGAYKPLPPPLTRPPPGVYRLGGFGFRACPMSLWCCVGAYFPQLLWVYSEERD